MKVLIIKTGVSETFEASDNLQRVVSLGDVLRTTVILHLFKNDEVSWLTSSEAFLLLDGLEEIKNLYVRSDEVDFRSYDLIVNLEHDPETVHFLARVTGQNMIGHVMSESGILLYGANFRSKLRSWLALKDIKKMNWSEKLFMLFGEEWCGENYLISHKHLINGGKDTFDVGLNWKVGIKWPSKSWPKENWELLDKRISSSWSVTWQEGFNNLVQYMNWVNSSRIIVTHDSLGLHLARALNKKILGLFGPTSSQEIYLGEGLALSESEKPDFSCPPCYNDRCHNMIHCMKSLSTDEVEKNLRILLEGTYGQSTVGWKQTPPSS